MSDLEYRTASLNPPEGEDRTIRGFVEVGRDQALPWGGTERILPGALRHGSTVLLRGHDPLVPLAREPGSMGLSEADGRLNLQAAIVETRLGDDALAEVKAGLHGLSVGFRVAKDRQEDGVRVVEAAELVEISLTPVPAHAGTAVRDRNRPPPRQRYWL